MAVALEIVVKQLEDSGIVAAGKLENFVPPKAYPKDAKELARQLVDAGNLTPFQAQHVLQGKTKALILGNYTILDKIGAGGMGQVFKAQHRRLERVVAIKMLPPAMTKDAAAVARFQREVKAAARLRHPNIVATDDADEANGAHFLVMEYVEGKDLSAHVKKNGPFSVDKAVNYILQAARGLEFAHAEGVIHRDIKPANLLLDKKGMVKILDMGLARIDASRDDVAAQAELTGTGAIMGTVDYMAPEQGVSTKDADARADIYSLGCSLHYLLIGKTVYGGESVGAKFLAHHNHPIPDLCTLRGDVSEQVGAIFRKMIAKKVEDRYQTTTEVVAELQAYGSGQATSLDIQQSLSTNLDNSAFTFLRDLPAHTVHRNVSHPGRAAEGGSKNRKPLLISAGAAGFLFVLLGLIVIFRNQKGEEVGRMELPDGTSVEVQATTMKPAIAGHTSPAVVEPARPPKPLAAPFDAQQAHAGQEAWANYLKTAVELKNSVGMSLVLIPPGEFLMGSTPEQNAVGRKMGEDERIALTDNYWRRLSEEMPQHKVTISQPFLLGGTEVSVAQFRKFIEASNYITEAEKYGFGNSGDTAIEQAKDADKGKNWRSPGYAVTDEGPVTQITWNDAAAFCGWISAKEHRQPWYRPDGKGAWLIAANADGYRLPTEAEWEFACRAGTTTQFSFGDDPAPLEQYGWFKKNARGKAQPVALKRPNAFGLFEMHGNAQEWCQDLHDDKWYERSSRSDPVGPSDGTTHLLRGGHWNYNASYCRSAYRAVGLPSFRLAYYGFRCVRPLGPTTMDAGLATASAVAPVTPTKPWDSPAFQQWVKATQALTAEQQVETVSKKLIELNPGFDGKVTPTINNGVVTALAFSPDKVADISPVRALSGLKTLNCSTFRNGKLSDLSPLQGMQLSELFLKDTQISDLSPLKGMPLTDLHCGVTLVHDLSPLREMKLLKLTLVNTKVTELSMLRGMPLISLNGVGPDVSDFSPLGDCKSLKTLNLRYTKVTAAQVAALQKALPNCKIEWDDPAKTKTPQPTAPVTK